MDLTSQSIIKHSYVVDTGTGTLTVTFKNNAENVTFGTIEMEATRYRAFIEEMALIAKALFGDLEPGLQKARTAFNVNTRQAVTKY